MENDENNLNEPVVETNESAIKMKSRAMIVISAFLGFALLGFIAWIVFSDSEDLTPVINSYAECVQAGYPVQESFPEKCVAENGETFVNDTTINDDLLNEDESDNPSHVVITELPENDWVYLVEPEDISKLPSDIPESFSSYMEAELVKNTVGADGCVSRYSISKYSSLNISGGVGNVDASSLESGDADPNVSCGGGAAAFWYLKDNQWSSLFAQATPLCSELESTTIYTEFISECYIQLDDSTEAKDSPNGSIQDS